MSHPFSANEGVKSPVRIGMLSFAHGHANSYAAALTKIDGVQICGIYDDDEVRGRNAAETFATTYYKDAKALLDQNLDGVIICSENSKHAPLVHLAAGSAHYILCEKPIATTVSDAKAMIDQCHATQTQLQIAFPVRFYPPFQVLKGQLDRQELGQIYCVKCTNHGQSPGGWFTDPTLAGGGAVMDHTVHVIDLLRWFWASEVVDLYAEVGTHLLHPDTDIDDVGMLSFRLANGVYGTLDTSWSRPKSYPTWGDVKIEVVGEKGMVTVSTLNQNLSVSSDIAGKTRWIPWGSNMDFHLIADFIQMIRTSSKPSITGEDGLRALEVALAAYQSSATHRSVALSRS